MFNPFLWTHSVNHYNFAFRFFYLRFSVCRDILSNNLVCSFLFISFSLSLSPFLYLLLFVSFSFFCSAKKVVKSEMAVSCDMKKKLEKVLKMEIGSKIYSMWTSPCSKLICSVVMWKFKASTQTIAKEIQVLHCFIRNTHWQVLLCIYGGHYFCLLRILRLSSFLRWWKS